MTYARRIGDVQGRTARDLPTWCDLSILPVGTPASADDHTIHIVWRAPKQGLFYCEYVFI